MKKEILILLTAILSLNCYSQISFEKGYFINNNEEKINCLIKTVDWNNNPSEIEYKLSEKDIVKTVTAEFVKEFSIDNNSKYITAKVNIDRSGNTLNKLNEKRTPIFNEELLFLKVLIKGKANLYQYLDNGLTRFFYNIEKSNIEQLVFISYKTLENKIKENNTYKQQLLNNLKCSDLKLTKFKNLEYYKKDLIQIFTAYNKCQNSDLTYTEPKTKRDFFNLTIRPRINSSSLTLFNSAFKPKDDIEFENNIGFGIGLEAEIILPIYKNSWTIFIEPTFQSYKSETKNNDISVILGGELITKVDYKSIEVPIGLRHYFFLKNNSMIFLDLSYVVDLSSNSSFEFNRSDTSNNQKININSEQNAAFGIGYKLKNKYSLEMRYQAGRELVKHNFIWSSDYETVSIIFGYTLF